MGQSHATFKSSNVSNNVPKAKDPKRQQTSNLDRKITKPLIRPDMRAVTLHFRALERPLGHVCDHVL